MPLYFADNNFLGSYGYASLPAASSSSGRTAIASDVGVAPGMLLISDGSNWLPAGTQVLLHSAIPIGIAPTGSMANNGAITLGTALDVIYSGGIYLYLPASAIVAGSAAGFYYTVMSSTTVGVVKNNTYTSGIPTIPASPVAFATTGPGAFTGSTAALNAHNVTLPGGLLGLNGGVRTSYTVTGNNNANGKLVSTNYGSYAAHLISIASVAQGTQQTHFTNRGVANAQICGTGNTGTDFGVGTATVNLGTVDSTASQTMALNIQHTTATDWIIVQSMLFEVMP